MIEIVRQTKKTARRVWDFRRFQMAIAAREWRQKLAHTNRVFDAPFPRCWCFTHCDHSGGLHSYVDEYARVLAAVKPTKVLEWGPGKNSELALATGATVVSIEQNREWLLPSTEGHQQLVIDVDDPEYIDPRAHWDADLFFVDSRRRAECIKAVHQSAQNREHVLCLHDAQRRRYHQALRLYRYVRFLSVGTAVASDSSRVLEI